MIDRRAPTKRLTFWLLTAVVFFVFLFLIRSILLPFVLGIFTAYFLDPAADKLEKYGFSRALATLVITIGFFFTIIFLSVLMVPVLASQISGLIAALPGYMTEFEQMVTPELTRWLGGIPLVDADSLKAGISNFSGVMVKVAGEFAAEIFYSGVAVVNLFSLVLITPVVAFYLLEDWDRIVARIDNLLPRAHADIIRGQLTIIDRTLAGFVRGQLNVCLILCTFYTLALSAAQLKFSIVIGIATGLLVIVPYVGWLVGASAGVAIAFFQFDNSTQIGIVVGILLMGMLVEGNFLTPKLVGKQVGLHPVWIIFGMLSGGALFGFVGVLLAVPATAVIGVLIRFATAHYLQSGYYQGDRALIER